MVPVNSVVGDIKGLNDIPIRSQGTQTVFIRDIGKVEDSSISRPATRWSMDAARSYIPSPKGGRLDSRGWFKPSKTTCRVSNPCCRTTSPSATNSTQSPYVTRAIDGLFFEGALGVVLTGS